MIRSVAMTLAVLTASCALAGCALLSKSDAITPRYYTPDYASSGSGADARKAGNPTPLRLGRVTASSLLRERMVYRASPEELGFYEVERWTERPENYLRRALSRALFEERGFVRVVGGVAPTLEAELVAFEEVRGANPKVSVQVLVTLDDDHVTQLEQTITVERALASATADEHAGVVARALGEALHEAVETIAERVSATLSSQAAAPAPN